jgi:L-asparaginase
LGLPPYPLSALELINVKKITLITTGGTIASRCDAIKGQTVASISGPDLLSTLHGDLRDIEIVVDEFANIGSFAFDLPLAFKLANRIRTHLKKPDCDGVVVTHGTDTMEESAFMADLLVHSDKPVVFTGAQRSADAPDTDGPRNILDAIRIASSDVVSAVGAVIVFEQDFHAARDVTKTHTSRVDTFASGEHGKLGEVDGEKVVLFRRPVLRKTYHPAAIVNDVDVIKLVIGSDDRLLRYAAKSGAKAIVLEAFGRGNATPSVASAVADITSNGTPVIVTSRCPQGRVRPVYGNGGGSDLQRAGAIFAGDLTTAKVRILLSILLGLGLADEQLSEEINQLAG